MEVKQCLAMSDLIHRGRRILRWLLTSAVPLMVLLALGFTTGCATSQPYFRDEEGSTDTHNARIIFKRRACLGLAVVPFYLVDRGTGIKYDTSSDNRSFIDWREQEWICLAGDRGDLLAWKKDNAYDRYACWYPVNSQLIGRIGPGGTLSWRRPPGLMRLELITRITSRGIPEPPAPCIEVEAGKTYCVEYDYSKSRYYAYYPPHDPAATPEPIIPCATPATYSQVPQPVQIFDRLPQGTAKGYAEFYIGTNDNVGWMIPIGEIQGTNKVLCSTVYMRKKLRIACTPGPCMFYMNLPGGECLNLGNTSSGDLKAISRIASQNDRFSKTHIVRLPDVQIQNGLVTPVRLELTKYVSDIDNTFGGAKYTMIYSWSCTAEAPHR